MEERDQGNSTDEEFHEVLYLQWILKKKSRVKGKTQKPYDQIPIQMFIDYATFHDFVGG